MGVARKEISVVSGYTFDRRYRAEEGMDIAGWDFRFILYGSAGEVQRFIVGDGISIDVPDRSWRITFPINLNSGSYHFSHDFMTTVSYWKQLIVGEFKVEAQGVLR
jgi:hypothetical protein